MSSKEQYKDALRQKTKIIASQAIKITELNAEISKLSFNNCKLTEKLKEANELLYLRKKWWQFWK
jgi:hypothetical protein